MEADGIQQLRAAEQEAQSIVASARQAKAARLRQAKEEAEREVAAYRATREQEFNARVSAQGSNSGSATARLQSESDATVARLTQQMAASKDAVVSKLVRAVTTVTA